ncbi:MAG: cupin domain-containing protein [Candidatus Eisenbacteria bacterium]|nr:cupin domain-containing protein [Candidatus Eisenbacteria bacterium]
MRIVRFSAAERYEPEPGWTRSSLCNEPDLSVEHFIKPPGHASPRHEHPQAQLLVVLDGSLIVETDEEQTELQPGDAAYFPGGEPHRVRNDGDTGATGLDIFGPGRSFDFWRRREGGARKEA